MWQHATNAGPHLDPHARKLNVQDALGPLTIARVRTMRAECVRIIVAVADLRREAVVTDPYSLA